MLLSTLIGVVLSQPLLLAHYMPWYEAKPVGKQWGWHWTMNHFDPEKKVGGRRQIASRFYPLIGPYDSSDPDAIEYQVLTMKLAGLDGAIIDWYGYDDVYDYAANHHNTLLFIAGLKKAGLKFAICYEDQTLPNLIKFGKVPESETISYAKRLMDWVGKNWFADPSYVRLDGQPVFLVFGPQYYKAPQWKEILAGRSLKIYGVNGQYDFATGGFAWPYPKVGNPEMEAFYKKAKPWQGFIGGAYPRFQDVYAEAKVHESWGTIPDDKGETFRKTFGLALAAKSPIIQIATWNDWGEGTMIEPSVEFGYRDLEEIQRHTARYRPEDLPLPLRLYQSRKAGKPKAMLDKAAKLLSAGDAKGARAILDR